MGMKMALFLLITSLSTTYLIKLLKLSILSLRSYNWWKWSFMSRSLLVLSPIFSRYISHYLDSDSAREGYLARIHWKHNRKIVNINKASPENEHKKPNNSILQSKIPNEHIRLLLNQISIKRKTIIIRKNIEE